MSIMVWKRDDGDCEAFEVVKQFCLEVKLLASDVVEVVLRMTTIIIIMELRFFAASFIIHSKFCDLIKLFSQGKKREIRTTQIQDE